MTSLSRPTPYAPRSTLHAVRRHLRLWRRFVVLAFVREAEYRVNFFLHVGYGLAQLAVAVGTFALLYRFTGEIAGWTEAEALLLVGVYRVVDGLIELQFGANLRAIGGYIRRGELDFYLLRPVSSQFLVSLRLLHLDEAVNVLIGLALALYAGERAGVRWSVAGVAEAAAFALCGLLLLYALWFAAVTCSFWLVRVDTLDQLFEGVFEAGRYPVSYFRGVVRAVLTFAVPVAFATTFPAEALRGTADARLLPVGLALTALALWCTHRFWRFAVRHYSSASS